MKTRNRAKDSTYSHTIVIAAFFFFPLYIPRVSFLNCTLPRIEKLSGLNSFIFHSIPLLVHFSLVQSFICVRLFVTPWTATHQTSLSISNSQSLLKLMSTESMMLSNHLNLCHPLLLPPSIFASIGVFSNESVLNIRWPRYWSFKFSISPSNEYSGLISFRMDWLDRHAVQGTLKNLLQHPSSKHQFFSTQLSL